MTKIYQVSGIGNAPQRKLFTFLGADIGEVTEGEMDLLIARDQMVTKRDIVARAQGIGSLKAQKFQNTIDVLDDALHGIKRADALEYMAAIEEDILSGAYSQEHAMAGIGDFRTILNARKAEQTRRRLARERRLQAERVAGIGKIKALQKAKTKTGKFLKKAAAKTAPALKKVVKVLNPVNQAKGVVKVAKKAGKAATNFAKTKAGKVVRVLLNPAGAVTRLAVKGLLEITLPKAAPFFLYLFINDPKIIAKLPPKVKRKRDKSLKVKNFIVNVIGMSDSHFMGIVRNGITKQMGASPETILSRSIKGISGIGADPYTTAIMFVIQLITKLVQVFKKQKPEGLDVTKDDAPSPSDFDELSEQEKVTLSSETKKQNDLPEPNEDRGARGEVLPTDEPQRNPAAEPSLAPAKQQQAASSMQQSQAPVDQQQAPSSRQQAEQDVQYKPTNQVNPADDTPSQTDENGEIQKQPVKPNDFATGGRKGWNSLG